jgi:2-methylaconitate cis-trans-isomerase PrpF
MKQPWKCHRLLQLPKAALARTARLLMDGHVYVPGR